MMPLAPETEKAEDGTEHILAEAEKEMEKLQEAEAVTTPAREPQEVLD